MFNKKSSGFTHTTKFPNLVCGFTLLEILLVVGIIAILAGIVIIAINPSRQLATTRNTERLSDLKQINNALVQYYIDHNSYPSSVSSISNLTEICDTGTATSTPVGYCTGLVDLTPLVPVYVVAIPRDPQGSISFLDKIIKFAYASGNGTGYKIMVDSSRKIVLTAPRAELNTVVAVGTTTMAFVGDDNLQTNCTSFTYSSWSSCSSGTQTRTVATSLPSGCSGGSPILSQSCVMSYNLIFNANGGTGSMTSLSINQGSSTNLTANTFTRTSYTFNGWNTAANGSGTGYANQASFTMGGSEVTLYAQWVSSIPSDGLLAHWGFDNGFYSSYLMDDSDSGFTTTGTWSTASPCSYSVHGNCRYVTPLGVGNNTASWSFTPTVSGQYKVYSYWYAHPTRGTNIPYSITSDSGTTNVIVNQNNANELASSTLLGTFNFTSGNSYSVTISDNATGGSLVIADAIDWILSSQGNTDNISLDDIGGNNATCSAIYCPAINSSGVVGQAFKFKTLGERFDFPTLNVGTTYSMSSWFKLDSLSLGMIIMGSPYVSGGYDYIGGFFGDNNVYLQSSDGRYVGVPWTYDYNWHHLVVTRSGTTVKFYLDGVQLGTTQTLATNPNAMLGMISGRGYNGGSNYFLGSLDEVRIYDRAISSSEVTTIYNVEKP